MIAFVVVVVVVGLIALTLVVGAETARPRRTVRVAGRRTVPRRQPDLEEKIRSAFDGPRSKHGDVFVSYAIWERDRETRMELFAADAFTRLNEFTRCLIVRHLWRALETMSAGSVVVVDSPPQTWSRAVDERFHDHGIDPWAFPTLPSLGPQYAKD